MYNFAYLEWGVICLAETLSPSFTREAREMTAGRIGIEFRAIAEALTVETQDTVRLQQLATTFSKELVRERDSLVHGNPITANTGQQRLHYDGRHGRRKWSTAEVLKAAQAFELAAIEANDLFHNGQYPRATLVF